MYVYICVGPRHPVYNVTVARHNDDGITFRITFDVSCIYVCIFIARCTAGCLKLLLSGESVRACVCLPPRLIITIGMMWHDMDPVCFIMLMDMYFIT